MAGGIVDPTSAALVTSAIEYMLTYVAAAALCHATIAELRGDVSRIGESLRFGIRLILPVTCIAILSAIVLIIGFRLPLHFIRGIETLLWIVPALFLTTIWWVVIPAAVVERRGVVGSFVRSARLTAGHRWRVFCVLVAVRGTHVAISMSVPYALVWAIGSEGIIAAYFGVGRIFDAIMVGFALVEAVLVAVTYHDLKTIEDGGELEWIASKFD